MFVPIVTFMYQNKHGKLACLDVFCSCITDLMLSMLTYLVELFQSCNGHSLSGQRKPLTSGHQSTMKAQDYILYYLFTLLINTDV